MRNSFRKGRREHRFDNLQTLYDAPVGIVTPSHLRQCIALLGQLLDIE